MRKRISLVVGGAEEDVNKVEFLSTVEESTSLFGLEGFASCVDDMIDKLF